MGYSPWGHKASDTTVTEHPHFYSIMLGSAVTQSTPTRQEEGIYDPASQGSAWRIGTHRRRTPISGPALDPRPHSPLTRQPQAQKDAVVDDRDDPSHTWGHRGALRLMAFKLLAQPTAVGCGQQGHP